MTTELELKDTERTSRGLREMLFNEIDRLRKGESTVAEARAIASLAAQVISTVNMEIAVAKLRIEYPADMKAQVPAPLRLEEGS